MKGLHTKISNLMKMEENSSNVSKTLWEKEKSPITSDFSFPHNFFKRLVLQTHKNKGLFGKGLTSSLLSLTLVGKNHYDSLPQTFSVGTSAWLCSFFSTAVSYRKSIQFFLYSVGIGTKRRVTATGKQILLYEIMLYY